MEENSKSITSGSAHDEEVHILTLYVAGKSKKCLTAYANLKKICKEQLKGRCNITVIDLLENPQRAREDQIVAVPTLVKMSPSPMRRVVGDLSNTEHVMVGLDL